MVAINDLYLRSLTDKDEVGNPPNLRLRSDSNKVFIGDSPLSYDFGALAESATKATGLDYFTITNKSSFAVNITISGTDMSGGNAWDLADDGNIGNMTYALKAGLDGGSYNIIVRETAPFNTLKSNLASGTTQKWGMTLYAPSTFTDGVAKTGTVTITAVAA